MGTHVIAEDVGRSGSTIQYDDSLEVFGSIRSGARIGVDGDLTVHGNVEDAAVEASGDVIIEGGFLGAGAGVIRCEGSLRARFVQGQRIEARGSVHIDSAVVSSTVFSSSDVVVAGDEGRIIGGTVYAYGKVGAAVFGSTRPVTTRIEVGVDPVMALEIERLERDAMDLTRKRIGFLKDLASVSTRQGSAQPGGRSALDMQAAADAIQGDLVAVGEEILKLRTSTAVNSDASVVVRNASYPPLEISICFSRLMNEGATGPLAFRLYDGRIILDTWNLE